MRSCPGNPSTPAPTTSLIAHLDVSGCCLLISSYSRDLSMLRYPNLWNTLVLLCLVYFSISMLDMGVTLGPAHCLWFTFHTPSLGLLGFNIRGLDSSDTMTFLPLIESAYSRRTMTLTSSKFMVFTLAGNGSVSSFIRWPLLASTGHRSTLPAPVDGNNYTR
jgi:hypothetical protein